LDVPPTITPADRDALADLDRRLLIVEARDVRVLITFVLP